VAVVVVEQTWKRKSKRYEGSSTLRATDEGWHSEYLAKPRLAKFACGRGVDRAGYITGTSFMRLRMVRVQFLVTSHIG
jgi:hypothetical protein